MSYLNAYFLPNIIYLKIGISKMIFPNPYRNKEIMIPINNIAKLISESGIQSGNVNECGIIHIGTT